MFLSFLYLVHHFYLFFSCLLFVLSTPFFFLYFFFLFILPPQITPLSLSRYGSTAAQIILSWHVLPGSVNLFLSFALNILETTFYWGGGKTKNCTQINLGSISEQVMSHFSLCSNLFHRGSSHQSYTTFFLYCFSYIAPCNTLDGIGFFVDLIYFANGWMIPRRHLTYFLMISLTGTGANT